MIFYIILRFWFKCFVDEANYLFQAQQFESISQFNDEFNVGKDSKIIRNLFTVSYLLHVNGSIAIVKFVSVQSILKESGRKNGFTI